MLSSNFIVRRSGLKEHHFYIDFNGKYELQMLEEITGISVAKLREVYEATGGILNEEQQVYYFNTKADGQKAVDRLSQYIKPALNTRTVEFTEAEIEYIRRALINEDSNIIFTKNKIRESIFHKLNM